MSRRDLERRIERLESDLTQYQAFLHDVATLYPRILATKPLSFTSDMYGMVRRVPLGEYAVDDVKQAARAVRAQRQSEQDNAALERALSGKRPEVGNAHVSVSARTVTAADVRRIVRDELAVSPASVRDFIERIESSVKRPDRDGERGNDSADFFEVPAERVVASPEGGVRRVNDPIEVVTDSAHVSPSGVGSAPRNADASTSTVGDASDAKGSPLGVSEAPSTVTPVTVEPSGGAA